MTKRLSTKNLTSKLRNPRWRRRQWPRLAVLGGIIVWASLYGLYRFELLPASDSGLSREFVVAKGDNAPAVAKHLAAAGLIRNRTAFVTYINLHGLRGELKVGTYMIKPSLTGQDIAELIAGGHVYTRSLLVPPGYTLNQIEDSATELGISKADFRAALAAPHNNGFLATKPAGVDLEGYLFPDSYSVGADTTAAQLVNAMLDNFGRHVGTEYQQAFAAEGLSLHQGLTIASIVEREVNIASDRPIVAQVFIKRLKSGMPLGSSVTACYAHSLQTGSNTCDENEVVSVQSPYNTLIHAGLPPGPICSPGLSSLDAVAHPANTGYLYFFTDKNGTDHFENTFAEQQANIAKYGLAGQ
jgi:UPF0755 protein